ncbi:ABC transporter substrate-binding protein [Serpentinicella sp. ANB-PHB4]|uniref:ABC transporter substrate-binding protein n=1 Tax=Serpentinicella sp. ANB-PHB4 TaxID=3074076 RepID=UPI00285E793C|nr:ABC transporter substrate-binding protein [Serpentinicella sp. ANB-PHB4]MDR5659839.1 ABC transporter substrate-binding protein [Serpentinicella sp. ANB-PHB4]
MKKTVTLLLALTLVVTIFATGCGRNERDLETLVVASMSDARSLDPHGTNDNASSRVMKQIYNTLMEQQDDLEVDFGLAKDYEMVSETEYRFELHQGVLFHNGEELTSNDVKFTFERMKEISPAAFLIDPIDRVEIEDDYNFTIHLKFPFGPFITHLSHTATAIVNEKAVLEAGEDFGRNPVGTGPFKFVEWNSGDSIKLERFDAYYEGPAASKYVLFRFISENTPRAIALENNEVDVIYDVGPEDFGNLAQRDGIVGLQTDGLTTFYLGFNVEKEPFNDVRVRQAINLALDVDLATEVAFQGYANTAKGPLSPNVQFANNDIEGYGHDIEEAKRLLAEAGFEDGFSTSIWTNDNPVRERYAAIFQEQLAQVGIEVSIETMEFAPYLDRTALGEHDMFMLGWVAVTGDADYGLYSLFHSDEFGDAGNRTFYANPRVDELLDIGKTSPLEEDRAAAYYEVQQIIFEEAPWVFLAFRDELNAHRDHVEGFNPHMAGHHSLYRVFNNKQ